MHARLAEIFKAKQSEVEHLKRAGYAATGIDFSKNPRDFKKALTNYSGIDLIAEIKFGSPTAGIIREISDPVTIGKAYEASGAAAISLLTDKKFFKGDLQNLPELKKAVGLPILRKDFIIDEVQIKESAAFGADAILLIARILSFEQLERLLFVSWECGLAVLTEIHNKEDLEKAAKCDAQIIGINNRDLDTFRVDLNTTLELAPLVPTDRVVISESGIESPEDMTALKGLNLQAVLVGSALMRAEHPGQKAAEMVTAGKIKG
jgi:indole-3-glycerol phosphate synthase